jgi:hypothetical protein
MKKQTWKIGDRCRIKTASGKLGTTLYEVVEVQTGGYYCQIREAGTDHAPHVWDISLLFKVFTEDPNLAVLNKFFFGA